MRVRFQVGEHAYCIARNNFYCFGEIDNLEDDMAKALIEGNIAKPFEDSFSNEEIRDLYENFINTLEFERKVDLFMMLIAKSNTKVKLSDGTELVFELTPTKPEEWYYYNKSLCDFYIKYFYRCRFDSFKENFERKLKNFPHYKTLRKKELADIFKTINDAYSDGIPYWYKKAIAGEIPLDEDGIKKLFSNKIYWGVENYLQGKAIAEYVAFLNTRSNQSKNDKDSPGLTKLFPEYLQTDQRVILAEKLKIEFSTDVGKIIRLMLEVLKDKDLLPIEKGQRHKIFETLKEYFAHDIGTYNSIFGRDPGQSKLEKLKKASVEKRIDFILNNMQ